MTKEGSLNREDHPRSWKQRRPTPQSPAANRGGKIQAEKAKRTTEILRGLAQPRWLTECNNVKNGLDPMTPHSKKNITTLKAISYDLIKMIAERDP